MKQKRSPGRLPLGRRPAVGGTKGRSGNAHTIAGPPIHNRPDSQATITSGRRGGRGMVRGGGPC